MDETEVIEANRAAFGPPAETVKEAEAAPTTQFPMPPIEVVLGALVTAHKACIGAGLGADSPLRVLLVDVQRLLTPEHCHSCGEVVGAGEYLAHFQRHHA